MDSHVPSHQVVEAIAEQEGVSPIELTPPLFQVIDPDALDALGQDNVDSRSSNVVIEFSYLGYDVRVQNNGTTSVSIEKANSPATSSASTPEHSAISEE